LRKYNDENLELSKNLRQEMNAQRRAAAKPMTATVTRKRDLNTGSARGSEERTAPTAPTRGTKRGREYEGIDKVSIFLDMFVYQFEVCVVAWCGGSPLAR
jgi:mortality factor 4-like protein 1